MPFAKKTKTFDFGPIGAPEFSCTIVDPKSLKYGMLRGITTEAQANYEARGMRVVQELVVSWNLTDDAGNPLPVPREKPEVLDELPVEAIQFIAQQIQEGVNPPKA